METTKTFKLLWELVFTALLFGAVYISLAYLGIALRDHNSSLFYKGLEIMMVTGALKVFWLDIINE